MKKILFTFITLLMLTLVALADNKQDALIFFNNYVNAANSYSSTIADMYSPTAKIIRQIVKPDGTTVNATTDTATYIKQMKIGQASAKLKHYKNFYTNIEVAQLSNDRFKVSSLRQPSGETYKLKAYMILEKQPSGKWLIVEELMQTKVQLFLKYADKN